MSLTLRMLCSANLRRPSDGSGYNDDTSRAPEPKDFTFAIRKSSDGLANCRGWELATRFLGRGTKIITRRCVSTLVVHHSKTVRRMAEMGQKQKSLGTSIESA